MIHDGLVRYHDNLADLLTPINDVEPHPANPNNGDLDAVAESIQVNGMYRPIYAQKNSRRILAGHTTWGACHELGATQIPVIWLDVDDTTALKIVLADNKTAHLATLDPALEAAALLALDAEGSALDGTGYTPHDLELLTRLNQTPLDPTDLQDPWPTLCVQVPPHVRNAYLTLTSAAGSDRERFEMMLRLAGWDG
jgi:hypothetical protein